LCALQGNTIILPVRSVFIGQPSLRVAYLHKHTTSSQQRATMHIQARTHAYMHARTRIHKHTHAHTHTWPVQTCLAHSVQLPHQNAAVFGYCVRSLFVTAQGHLCVWDACPYVFVRACVLCVYVCMCVCVCAILRVCCVCVCVCAILCVCVCNFVCVCVILCLCKFMQFCVRLCNFVCVCKFVCVCVSGCVVRVCACACV